MNFLPGKPIDDSVRDHIEVRQKVYGAKDGLSRQAYIEYQKKVPWIKMTSGVRVRPGSETANRFNLSTNDALAREYELFNFLDKGVSDLPGYQDTSLGYRPRPGILDMQIHSHNRFGSLRTAVVKFQCWSKEQLDALELLYMRPGYSVLLQWGHSVYLQDAETVLEQIQPLDYFKYSTASSLSAAINKKKRDYKYSYDAIYGLIKNFSWSLRTDGGYDCQTSIVTTGDIIESFKANLYLSQRELKEEADKSIAEYNEKRKKEGLANFAYPPLAQDQGFGNIFPSDGSLSEEQARQDDFVTTVNAELAKLKSTISELSTYPQLKVLEPGDKVYYDFETNGRTFTTTLLNSNKLANPSTKQFSLASYQFNTLDELKQAVKLLTQDGTFKQVSIPSQSHSGKGSFYRSTPGELIKKYPPQSYQVAGDLRYFEPALAEFVVLEYPGYGTDLPGTQTAPEGEEATSPDASLKFASRIHYTLLAKYKDKYTLAPSSTFEGKTFIETFQYRATTTNIQELVTKEDFNQPNFKRTYQDTGALGGYFKTQSQNNPESPKTVYIKLGLLLAFFNKYLIRSSSELMFKFRTMPVDSTNPPKYFTFDDHISVDPTVCILPHNIRDLGILKTTTLAGTASAPEILKIEVSVDHIVSLLNTYIDTRGRVLMLDFFEALFSDIKRVTGGVNELELQFDEESSIFTVVDRRALEVNSASKYPELNIFGLGSFVKDFNLVSKLTPKMGSMIAISAQASPFTSTEESTGFAALNKDLQDSIYTERTDDEKERITTGKQSDFIKIKEQLYEDISSVIQAIQLYYQTRTNLDSLKDLYCGAYENFVKFAIGAENKPAYSFIIPFELSVTLDGISSLRVMEAFRINKNILPYTYGGNPKAPIGFIITGVEHTVNQKEWSTVLRTQIFNIEEIATRKESTAKGILTLALNPTPNVQVNAAAITSKVVDKANRIKEVARYLKGKGLIEVAATGLIANLLAESGLEPTTSERGVAGSGQVGGKGGIGIAQWTNTRRRSLEAAYGNDLAKITNLNNQLDYLYKELTDKYNNSVLKPIQSAITPSQAATIVLENFEVPLTYLQRDTNPGAYLAEQNKRIAYANKVLPYVQEVYTNRPASLTAL